MANCNCDHDESSGQSILESVKQDLGAMEWDDAFDATLIRDINTVFIILKQLGVGPSQGFRLETGKETWEDYDQEGINLEAVKTYMYKRVKLMFDPSTTSFINENDREICNELEWRLNVAVDPG